MLTKIQHDDSFFLINSKEVFIRQQGVSLKVIFDPGMS